MENQTQLAMRVSITNIVINGVLSLGKLFVGIVAGSGAMISDSVDSACDIISTLVAMIGVKLADRKSDHDHPYGHERLECIAAIILSVMLFATGLGIGYSAIMKIIKGVNGDLAAPGMLAVVAAVVSIVIKEWMYWFTMSAAKKVNSGALMANAWNYRSDVMSAIGIFAGILGARAGYPILDPIASVVICFFILRASYNIMVDGFSKMVDQSCDKETIEKMKEVILNQQGVLGIDLIRTRLFGSKIYVDIEICADSSQSFEDVHHISEQVHDAIEDEFKGVKHCMVHVNPKNVQ